MYPNNQAKTDFLTIGRAAGFDDGQLEEAIEAAEVTDERAGLGYLAELCRELFEIDDNFESFFDDKEGHFDSLTFLTDDDCDIDISQHLDGEALEVFTKGQPVAYHDADRWVLLDGNLYRVHPESMSNLGPFLQYIQAQIQLVLGKSG